MSTPVITIFVRHSADCKYAGDETCKRCQCRKHFRWTQNGKQQFRKAGTRSWAEAEDNKRRLEDELAGRTAAPVTEGQPISAAIQTFYEDKAAQGLAESSVLPYKRELPRLQRFCESQTVYTVQRITLPLLIAYRNTWTEHYPSSTTRDLAQKRLKHFLRFCHHAGWLPTIPKLSPIKVDEPETMPLTATEYAAVLAAIPKAFLEREDRLKVRALIQLMRWSGLAVRDASTLRKTELIEGKPDRVVVDRQKTDTHVSVPIPPEVMQELLTVGKGNAEYIFENRGGSESSHAHYCGQRIKHVFYTAKVISKGHMISHRLRDTFAVDLLEKGVPLEEVSKLLGHTSIKTTERHYAKWVKGRQDRLDNLVTGTWKV